jgi:hypothetical protein
MWALQLLTRKGARLGGSSFETRRLLSRSAVSPAGGVLAHPRTGPGGPAPPRHQIVHGSDRDDEAGPSAPRAQMATFTRRAQVELRGGGQQDARAR